MKYFTITTLIAITICFASCRKDRTCTCTTTVTTVTSGTTNSTSSIKQEDKIIFKEAKKGPARANCSNLTYKTQQDIGGGNTETKTWERTGCKLK